VLTDFARYPEWNPFMQAVHGVPEEGTALVVRINKMLFRPRVLTVDPPRELRWRGTLLRDGLFDGEHSFEIESLSADRVRFRQSERFTGLLVPLIWLFMARSTQRGFEAMNAALKRRVEGKE
jgi:hypothetical protein